MNSVTKAKERLKKYPLYLAQCRDSGGQYAKCVVRKANVGKDDCLEEFMRFKRCLTEAARSSKSKL